MSSNTPDYIYPIIVPSDSNVEDAFSSTTTPDYTPASPDYSQLTGTPLLSFMILSKYLLSSQPSHCHDDKIVLARIRLLLRDTHRGNPRMAPKRTSTSAAPAMSQAAIRKLVADSVAAALEAQAATMANTDNTTRNTGPRETPITEK
ncbi:hypothetical protein Tco_0667887 [Tanacetum coccineum]